MKVKPDYPQLIDIDDYFKSIIGFHKIQTDGYMDIELSRKETMKRIKIPVKLNEFFGNQNVPTYQFVNMILRDFVIRMFEGESKYRKGILKRINETPESILTAEQKDKLIVHLFSKRIKNA